MAVTANPPSNAPDNAPDNAGDRLALLRAARGGLCGRCIYARLVRSSRESVFVRCTRPELPKYQGQPVLRCTLFKVVLS